MDVAVFVRKPGPFFFSLERVCADIVGTMPENVSPRVVVMPYHTRGFYGVPRNMAYARSHAGEVNHVLGDIHYVACALPAKSTLLTIADCTLLVHRSGLRRAALRWLWYTWPVSRCALITTISESTRQELLRLIKCPPDKVRVVHVSVSASFTFSPKMFDIAYPTILHVGTKVNKNLGRLAQALEGIPCHLRIIGPLSEQQRAALERASIIYSSAADISDAQLVQEYRDCDMLVFASIYEGFGMPIVEAQATGRPVITSNLCSMPEVAGDGAVLVAPYDVASIRAGVLRVLREGALREELVEKGLRNAQRFRPESSAAQYAALYEQLAASRG